MKKAEEKLNSAHERGMTSNCPYCLAFEDTSLTVGSTIVFLKGHDAGCRGVVQECSHIHTHCGFAARMDYEMRGSTFRIVSPHTDLFLDVRRFDIPQWMPPLSMDDNAWIHDEMFRHISVSRDDNKRQAMRKMLIGLTSACWARRLPLNGKDIFQLLRAHGWTSCKETEFCEQLDFGMQLLMNAHGRTVISKRRMPPMSQGRYLTERQREFAVRLRGGVGKNDV